MGVQNDRNLMVTLWHAIEGFKVLRPSGFEIFQFFSIVPEIFAKNIFRQNNEILFLTNDELFCINFL